MSVTIELEELSKTYGSRRGLAGLSLRIHSGEVLGYLGPNGAGKSTTIRLLLGLLRPSSGTARLLGRDPRAEAVELHRRIGYLPGDFVVDGRQTVRECLTYFANLRGGVPRARIDELADRLDLEQHVKIKKLSKGNRQKVGVIQAFMHRPELLILDEPTTGLDPLVQDTFLEMVREARADGQTVFMSSHIMSEVEAVADRVGIIRAGELVTLGTIDDLRARALLHVRIGFDEAVDPAEFAHLPGVTDVAAEPGTSHDNGTVLTCRVPGAPDPLVKAAARHSVTSLSAQRPDLEELFIDHYQEDTSNAA